MKDSYFVFVKYITPTTMILGGLASVSFLILLLALIFSLGGVRGNLLGAGSVSYDFEADSIGATPANTTVLAGSVQVANSPESSNALNFTGTENNSNTPGSASLSLVRLDSVPAESEDITVTWQQSYNTGARSGPLLRWDDSTQNGYLFQVNDNSMNDLRIYRIMGTGAHTTLATAPLAGQSPRWFRASITGAQLTFEYSNDGISYTEAISHTDSSELNTEGPVVWSAGYGALGDVYLDDITVDYTTASSADGQLVLSYTGDGLAVSEGGSGDSYTVALIEAPTDDVVVSIAPADNVTGAAVSPTTLTFTPSDWETPQLVNVSAIDDSVVEFMHFDAIEHTVSSDDSNYDGVTVSPLRVTIKDNDTPQSGYDFSLDTVGSNNPGATTTLTGSYQVSSDPAMGNAITPSSYNSNGLDYSANLATIRFDNASTSATDVGVTWRRTSTGAQRDGVMLRHQDGVGHGYLFQISSNFNDLRIYNIGSSIQILDTFPLTLTNDMWFHAKVIGDQLEMYYSFDGETFYPGPSTTSSAYASGSVMMTAGWAGTGSAQNVNFGEFEIQSGAVMSVGNLSIQSPANYQLIQRGEDDLADIPLSLTYLGSPESIEARWNGGDWIVIDDDPSGGSVTAVLAGQSVGQGALEVRFGDDHDTTASIEFVSVGDLFAIAGQSNASGRGVNNQFYEHPTLKAARFNGSWGELLDPADGVGGTVWPLIATHLMASTDVPVAFIPDPPQGGTSVTQWQKGGGLYNTLTSRINSVGDIKAILWWQGESNVASNTSYEDYLAGLEQLVDDFYQDFGVDTVVAQIGQTSSSNQGAKSAVRIAQQDSWTFENNSIFGPVLYDVPLTMDQLHFRTDLELEIAAERWWQTIEYHFYDGQYGRSPYFYTAEVDEDATRILVYIQTSANSTLFAQEVVEGFTVFSDGSAVTIDSATVLGDNVIEIVTASVISNPTVTFAFGDSANGAEVPVDTSPVNMPLEVFLGRQVAENALPVIDISAVTKEATAEITDTVITVSDNGVIFSDDITIGAGTSLEYSGFDCENLDPQQIECGITITGSGDLEIVAVDWLGNQISLVEAGYVVDIQDSGDTTGGEEGGEDSGDSEGDDDSNDSGNNGAATPVSVVQAIVRTITQQITRDVDSAETDTSSDAESIDPEPDRGEISRTSGTVDSEDSAGLSLDTVAFYSILGLVLVGIGGFIIYKLYSSRDN